jgi:hypothetical protein
MPCVASYKVPTHQQMEKVTENPDIEDLVLLEYDVYMCAEFKGRVELHIFYYYMICASAALLCLNILI